MKFSSSNKSAGKSYHKIPLSLWGRRKTFLSFSQWHFVLLSSLPHTSSATVWAVIASFGRVSCLTTWLLLSCSLACTVSIIILPRLYVCCLSVSCSLVLTLRFFCFAKGHGEGLVHLLSVTQTFSCFCSSCCIIYEMVLSTELSTVQYNLQSVQSKTLGNYGLYFPLTHPTYSFFNNRTWPI